MSGLGRSDEFWGQVVREGAPVVVIAEIANAHEGSVETAERLVVAAADAGADAVKFQCFAPEELLVRQHPKFERVRGYSLPESAWERLVAAARERGLFALADVFGPWSAALMERLGADGIEIHASDTLNAPLLELVGCSHRPVLLSVAGGTAFEVAEAIQTLKRSGAERIALLHGYQGFPTAVAEAHLRRLATLRERFHRPVGLSDHTAGGDQAAPLVPLAALGIGIRLVEKHLTLDRAPRGTDHHAALEPAEFARFVEALRRVEPAVGSPDWRLSEGERAYRRTMRKQLVAARPITAGQRVAPEDLVYRRAAADVEPLWWEEAVGRVTARALAVDDVVTLAHLRLKTMIAVIVRMHSTRLPGKALVRIGGQTAIEHLIDRVKLATAGEPVLCTSDHADDAALIPIAERKGIAWFRGSQDDVLARLIGAAEQAGADLVVRVTGDDLFIDPEHLDRTVAFHAAHNADYTRIDGLPSGTECEVLSLTAMRRAHRWAEDPSQTEYLTWYVNDPDLFRVAVMPAAVSVRRPYRLTLDTPQDLEVVRRVLEAISRGPSPYRLADVIAWLDAHPEVAALNAVVQPKLVRSAVNTRFRVEV